MLSLIAIVRGRRRANFQIMSRNSGDNLAKQVNWVNFLLVVFFFEGACAGLGRNTRLDGGACLGMKATSVV
jgi:hypothetical protein